MIWMLACDHRKSLERDFFGLTGQPTAADEERCRRAKALVLQGMCRSVLRGVPSGTPAFLVDAHYGAHVVGCARASNIVVALAVERSGERELHFEQRPFFAGLRVLDVQLAKVLVRYNPGASSHMNARQRKRILQVQRWAGAHRIDLLLELLVPAEAGQLVEVGGNAERYDRDFRPTLTIQAIAELVAAGITPKFWKVEGMATRDQFASVAGAARAARKDSSCLVLGRGADSAMVEGWLRTAASVPGYAGFAVGRTIWWNPLKRYFQGEITALACVDEIDRNYMAMVAAYLSGTAPL